MDRFRKTPPYIETNTRSILVIILRQETGDLPTFTTPLTPRKINTSLEGPLCQRNAHSIWNFYYDINRWDVGDGTTWIFNKLNHLKFIALVSIAYDVVHTKVTLLETKVHVSFNLIGYSIVSTFWGTPKSSKNTLG